MLLFFRFYKSLKIKKDKDKPVCDFKISKPDFSDKNNKRFANFTVGVSEKHIFFRDFPILFKFFSDNRLKSKVKITYKTAKKSRREEIINKTIIFNFKSEEYIYYINDIIIGKIYIEIELDIEYGNPIIEFIILENNTCKLDKEYKLQIDFPKNN